MIFLYILEDGFFKWIYNICIWYLCWYWIDRHNLYYITASFPISFFCHTHFKEILWSFDKYILFTCLRNTALYFLTQTAYLSYLSLMGIYFSRHMPITVPRVRFPATWLDWRASQTINHKRSEIYIRFLKFAYAIHTL